MTISFYISMTSGIRGPESELTQEQADKVAELAQQLSESIDMQHRGLKDLHPTNYVVSWYEETSPVKSVHVDAYGYTMVWLEGDQDWRYYKDTVGLWSYLAPIGYATLQKWIDESTRSIKR